VAERGVADGFPPDDDRDRRDVCLLQRGEDAFERLVGGGRLAAGKGRVGGGGDRVDHVVGDGGDDLVFAGEVGVHRAGGQAVNSRGRIIRANAAAASLFGFEEHEINGMSVRALFPGRPPIFPGGRSGQGGQAGHYLELVGRRRDSSQFPAVVSVMPVRIGNVLIAIMNIRDFPESEQAQSVLSRRLEILMPEDMYRQALLRQLVRAREEERARIAADIHDDASGYLIKSATGEEIIRVICVAAGGETVIPAGIPIRALAVYRESTQQRAGQALLESLTPRERQILAMMTHGTDNRTVAERLQISYATVRTHVRSILAKLGARSQLEAVTKARKWGFRG
jgi:PAS domain S-box-containing protein